MRRAQLRKAIALHQAGDLRRAESHYKRILREHPRQPDALHLLGCVRLQRGRAHEAIRLMKQAIEAAPVTAIYHENLADAYYRIGEKRLAESECDLALRLDESLYKPWNLKGLIGLDMCDYGSAVDSFSAALKAKVPYLDGMLNIAVAFNRTGEYKLAQQYCELALKIEPENPLAWTNLGMAFKGMRRLEDAKTAFRRAKDFPMAEYNLGYVYLLENNLADGLPLCEARKLLLGVGKGLRKPEWDGTPRQDKRLLVLHEQGLGDTILMSRFYPMLFDYFEHVTIAVQEPLLRLIATVSPDLELTADAAGAKYDFWCSTLSLPYLLQIDSVDEIPLEPWLKVPRTRGSGEKLRVGLNWAGNPRFAYDYVRSTHLENLKTFLQVTDVDWCSLHKGHLEHEAEAFGLPEPLKQATDFYDTALVVNSLDLVVSTETVIPNLSAALGVPTCVLTGSDRDWRWESWYRDAVVCEQEAQGNWYGPIARVLEMIRDRIEASV